MSEKTYLDLLTYIRKHPKREKYFTLFIQYCPLIDVCIYPLLLMYVALYKRTLLLKCILIPLASFLVCTIIRRIYNSPRPYDVYDLEPIASHSPGESCPSRHTVSAFAIGYCCLYINTPLGIITLLFACVVAVSRILGGLHFPKDVFYGFLLASLFALLY